MQSEWGSKSTYDNNLQADFTSHEIDDLWTSEEQGDSQASVWADVENLRLSRSPAPPRGKRVSAQGVIVWN
ncbi:hypothetical protein E2C01_073848 [Portunus trituberculatus]|uniref:Uncharacterized protein n=1 Tax=Portunus trituberculatus TaxID=210409 RepID=A0A5B7IAT4_PORTR|nr:hypothetical protein [Portunus trituberculatus]